MPIHLPPLSRRRFLAGSLAAGAGVLLSRSLPAAEAPADPDRWVLLADIHVWEQRKGTRRGINPDANFAQAASEIAAIKPRPAGVIIAGDLVYLDGHAADYAVLADLVKPIRAAGIPMHFVLGNHDHRANFWAAFPEAKPQQPLVPDKHVGIIATRHANWFLLDTLEQTHGQSGRFGKEQLDWLAQSLATRPDKPALLVAHHDLSLTHGLRDGKDLLAMATGHKQVQAYFFGHTHQWSVKSNGIYLINIPAIAWLFSQSEPRGWLDMTLRDGGATLVLNTLDKKHPKHGERVELKWHK